jgi:hypothetical protein
VSILDILLVLARHKRLIVRIVLAFALLGVTYALLAPEEFTSEAKVVREAAGKGPDISGGLGGLAGGLAGGAVSGLLGGASSGLGPEAFPEVLKGRTVRLAVVRDTFRFPDVEQPMTFVEYVNRPSGLMGRMLDYTVWLPWTLKEALGRQISSGSPAPAGTTAAGDPLVPSEDENAAMKAIEGVVSTSVDQETGLMTISATAGGPRVASDLTKSFLDHFSTRVREIRTKKVRERLTFVEQRFQEAEKELETAEARLAQFLERNQNPTTATLQFRRDQLRRQVTFKEQLYSKLQSQLTQTQLDLQRRQPVVTVVEKPVPPASNGGLRLIIIVLLSMILGGLLGVLGAFVKTFLETSGRDPEQQQKLEEIRNAFFTSRWSGRLWDRVGAKEDGV